VHKVWAVIRREFIERVRTKWFIISTVLGPLFMIAITVLPGLLAAKTGRVNTVVLVNEGAGSLAQRLDTQLQRGGAFVVINLDSPADRHAEVIDSLTREVQTQSIDGFLSVSPSTLVAGTVEYQGRNVSSLRDMGLLERAVRQSIMVERLTSQGIDPATVQDAQSNIDLRTLRITRQGTTGASGEATFFLGYIVGLILYMVILLYGINVMRSVLQEKQDRIIEILVSSLKPFQLMLGKVIGVAGVGLFQFLIWTVTGYVLVHYRSAILAAFHASQSAQSVQLPPIGGTLVAVAIAYFVLGYLLYSGLFAVVGASCTTDSEAQQAQQPVMMLLVASLMLLFPVLNDPAGRLAVIASMVPLSAPIIMPIRVAASDVAPTEIAMSIAIMIAAAVFVVWGSARIYRIGILMYGKRPSMKELWRWARQS